MAFNIRDFLAILFSLEPTDTASMELSKFSFSLFFLLTVYCNFANPCIHWVLHDTSTASLKFHNEFINNYHYLFPEHVNRGSQGTCSSRWRVEGYLYRNDSKPPVFNSVFGVFGSRDHFNSQILHLNLSVTDTQIPDRDAEHILIEYSASAKSFNLKKVLTDLTNSFHKQLVNIMKAQSINAPVYLNSIRDSSDNNYLEFWLNQNVDFDSLR